MECEPDTLPARKASSLSTSQEGGFKGDRTLGRLLEVARPKDPLPLALAHAEGSLPSRRTRTRTVATDTVRYLVLGEPASAGELGGLGWGDSSLPTWPSTLTWSMVALLEEAGRMSGPMPVDYTSPNALLARHRMAQELRLVLGGTTLFPSAWLDPGTRGSPQGGLRGLGGPNAARPQVGVIKRGWWGQELP